MGRARLGALFRLQCSRQCTKPSGDGVLWGEWGKGHSWHGLSRLRLVGRLQGPPPRSPARALPARGKVKSSAPWPPPRSGPCALQPQPAWGAQAGSHSPSSGVLFSFQLHRPRPIEQSSAGKGVMARGCRPVIASPHPIYTHMGILEETPGWEAGGGLGPGERETAVAGMSSELW